MTDDDDPDLAFGDRPHEPFGGRLGGPPPGWLPTRYWPGATYPVGPRFARPRQGLARGRAPSDPQPERRVMSAGRGVWVKICASEAERAAWHAKARSALEHH